MRYHGAEAVSGPSPKPLCQGLVSGVVLGSCWRLEEVGGRGEPALQGVSDPSLSSFVIPSMK